MEIDRTKLVPLKTACDVLGCSSTNIINTPKYQDFYYPIKGRRNARVFDLEGYKRKEDLGFEFIEKTKLFIEWLIHEANVMPTTIADKAKVSRPQVYEHSLSIQSAYKIVKTFEWLVPQFDEFYGWRRK